MLSIIDAHAHLASLDVEETLARSHDGGVVAILSNATRPNDWNATLNAAKHEMVHAALGVHPFFADEWSDAAQARLIQHIEAGNVAAIGEIGLDGFPQYAQNMEAQLCTFEAQLKLAQQYNLPVCLHLRKAWSAFFATIKRLGISCLKGYCHNFTGSVEIARSLLSLDLHVSLGSSIVNAKHASEAVAEIPLDRLLTETDCPDMAPSPEHALTPLNAIAEIKGLPTETIATIIEQNFRSLLIN